VKVGDKVIIKREICANNCKNPHFGKIATVQKIDRLNQVGVSIDSFPNCNHRDYHNRFWYGQEELEVEKE
jgi:hypothetical protein